MDGMVWILWVMVFLLAVLGIVIWLGKGDVLLFRSEETKERYHVGRLRLVFGAGSILLAALLAASTVARSLTGALPIWFLAVYALVALAMVALRRFYCAK